MVDNTKRKKELDRQRTEWRKKHRTLNGRIILYPEKPPEHINARASKVYNWFWKKILLQVEPQEIPAIISAIQDQIKAEDEHKKIQMFRTMIGMAEDAYQLKKLDEIKDYDTELMLGKKPVFNSDSGVIYKDGNVLTTDYDEEESSILLRDIEGIIIDVISAESKKLTSPKDVRNFLYKNWNYSNNRSFANK
jgi:hypothetical protein